MVDEEALAEDGAVTTRYGAAASLLTGAGATWLLRDARPSRCDRGAGGGGAGVGAVATGITEGVGGGVSRSKISLRMSSSRDIL